MTSGCGLPRAVARRARCLTNVSAKRSTGLTEAAWTRTRTPSAETAGVATSATRITSGVPGRSQTAAFTDAILAAECGETVAIPGTFDLLCCRSEADHLDALHQRLFRHDRDVRLGCCGGPAIRAIAEAVRSRTGRVSLSRRWVRARCWS